MSHHVRLSSILPFSAYSLLILLYIFPPYIPSFHHVHPPLSLTSTMPYSILPATPADLPDIVAIFHAAFADDPFIRQLMPKVPPHVRQAHDMHYFGREFEMSELKGLCFRKVVDGDGYDRDSGQLGHS